MRTLVYAATALMLVAGGVLGASCLVDRKTSAFTCSSPDECEAGRTCTGGFCVVVDASPFPRCAVNCTGQGGICSGDTCTFTNAASVVCPAGIPCEVTCNTSNACGGGIDCSQAASCTVSCGGDSSCAQRTVCGNSSPCDVTCNGPNSCAASVACGSNACSVTCSGASSCLAATTCSNSCGCGVTCSGVGACAMPAVCPQPPGAANQCVSGSGCTTAPNKCHC